ncbi:MAG: carboxypeptidase-like regulatory domain-containing protein, partial [Candidatus Hydrogenedentales bacterium]
MNSRRSIFVLTCAVLSLCAAWSPVRLAAQGVTTGGLGGVVTAAQKQPVAGASVIAIHEPSGTSYEATTRADGRYTMPNMRVGGPYTIQVVYAGGGGGAFAPKTVENINVNLGVTTDV